MAGFATSATFFSTADQIQVRSSCICLFGPTISLCYVNTAVVMRAFLFISILLQSTSNQHVFVSANLSNSVCAARPHPCWFFLFFLFFLLNKAGQSADSCSPEGALVGDLSDGTKKCWRGPVFVGVWLKLRQCFCQLKHIYPRNMYGALTGELLFDSWLRLQLWVFILSQNSASSISVTRPTIPPSWKTTVWTWVCAKMSMHLRGNMNIKIKILYQF